MITVSVVNIVMEWPEGKLLWPRSILPVIRKLVGLNTAAGRGTANITFKRIEKKAEIKDADSNASHNVGPYTTKTLKSDRPIKQSPNCVKLDSRRGYFPK